VLTKGSPTAAATYFLFLVSLFSPSLALGLARVSTCDHMDDGRVISGGGDGKVIVWGATGTSCRDLDGHASAVSKVQTIPTSRLALSSGYDGMVRKKERG